MTDIAAHVINNDILGTSLQPALGEERDFAGDVFGAEYGLRSDDGAMVVHVFPPAPRWEGLAEHEHPRWEAGEHDVLRIRLQAAMDTCGLDPARIRAEYVPEVESYCVIFVGASAMPDPWAFTVRFLSSICMSPATSS